MKSLPTTCFFDCLVLLLAAAAAAQDLRLATWNVAGPERDAGVLAQSAEDLAAAVGTVDVLVLQEVISDEQVQAVAEALGHEHWVISDFSPPPSVTGSPFRSLEAAVTSALPIEGAGEWDPTGRAANGDNFVPRASSEASPTQELAVPHPVGELGLDRGFLRVDLADGLSVYAVHWKSSRGQSCNTADLGFARQREAQANGVVRDTAALLAEARTVVVTGNFNIQAPGRVPRVGTMPTADCAPTGSCDGGCGASMSDGYVDSIATLLEDLENARLLSGDLPEIYLARSFPGGAINHILVAGPLAAGFSDASVPDAQGTSFAGSDDRPEVASLASGDRAEDDEARVLRLFDENRSRVAEIEQILGE